MAKNEKKNKENKRRLLLLILLLVVTVVMLSTATYAWFTSNKVVNVDDLNVNVRAVNGLEISADAIEWGTIIDKDDLIGASSNYNNEINQLPDSLGHASTVLSLTNAGLMQMYDGIVVSNCPGGGTDCDNPTYTLSTRLANEGRCYDSDGKGNTNSSAVPKCTSTNAHFMAFDIFLKVDRDDTQLYLTANADVLDTSASGNDLGIKNTTRVAFVVEGYMDSTTYYGITDDDYSTIQDARNGSGTVKLWEPNAGSHTVRGVRNASTYYGITSLSAGDSNSPVAYDGVNKEFNDVPLTETRVASGTYGSNFTAMSPDIVTNAGGQGRTNNELIVLNNGVTKVRVYFWVEGNDVDTENTATGSDMKLNLEFSIA